MLWHATPQKLLNAGGDCMKKVLVILLALAVAGGLFADVTGMGRVRTDFGYGLDLEDSDKNPGWFFNFKPQIGLTGGNDAVNFWVRVEPGDGWAGEATVNLGSVALTTGKNELPWAQWSNLAFLGDSNWASGASASNANPFIMARFIDMVYLGLTEGGLFGFAPLYTPDFPGFFIGGDYAGDGFSVGGAFAGMSGKDALDESHFGWMGNLHVNVAFDPLTVGVNLGFYGEPKAGFFAINYGDFGGCYGGADAMVLEAMLNVGIGLDNCAIGITGALLMDLDSESMGIKVGASAAIDLGGGFNLIPGLRFTTISDKTSGTEVKSTGMDIGLTLQYAF
jgi:hypothetical protein